MSVWLAGWLLVTGAARWQKMDHVSNAGISISVMCIAIGWSRGEMKEWAYSTTIPYNVSERRACMESATEKIRGPSIKIMTDVSNITLDAINFSRLAIRTSFSFYKSKH